MASNARLLMMKGDASNFMVEGTKKPLLGLLARLT